MKNCCGLFLLAAFGLTSIAREAENETATLRLTRAYDAYYDHGDVNAMYVMLDPECVMKTPFSDLNRTRCDPRQCVSQREEVSGLSLHLRIVDDR